MKKIFKIIAISLAGLFLFLLLGLALLPFVFPVDKIKDFAVAKLSETLHREVKIERASFNLFSGIKLEKLSIRGLVSADTIELHYAFWPLFSRQIIIQEISLVKPEIYIEKTSRGDFNFSDLLKKAERRKPINDTGRAVPAGRQVTEKRTAKPPFDIFIASFSLKNGRITYVDRSTKTTSEIKDLNIKVSGFELALIKPIDLAVAAKISYQGKEFPVSLAGQVGVDLMSEKLTIPGLVFSLAGESASLSAQVSGWKKSPRVELSLASNKLTLDPVLAIFMSPVQMEKPKAKPKPGELTKTINRAIASLPSNLNVTAALQLKNISFQKFKLDSITASAALTGKRAALELKEIRIYDGVLSGKATVDLVPGLSYKLTNLKLTNFNAAPFSNAVVGTFLTGLSDSQDLMDKVFGRLDLACSLSGRGVEPQDILANASGAGAFSLKGGELKRLKILSSVGKTLKSNTLQDNIKFGELAAEFGLNREVIDIKNLKIDENDFKLHFKGGLDLNQTAWVPGNRLTLKLAPALTPNLPKELALFKDNRGWLELTFEITGSLKLPIPKPILDKPVEIVIGKIKAKIEAKKIELEEKAQVEIATKEAEVKKAIETEAGRIKEEAKQQIKNLLKF